MTTEERIAAAIAELQVNVENGNDGAHYFTDGAAERILRDLIAGEVEDAERWRSLKSAAVRFGVGNGGITIENEDGEWSITSSDFEPFAFGPTLDAAVDALRSKK